MGPRAWCGNGAKDMAMECIGMRSYPAGEGGCGEGWICYRMVRGGSAVHGKIDSNANQDLHCLHSKLWALQYQGPFGLQEAVA